MEIVQEILTEEDCRKILHRNEENFEQLLSYKTTKFSEQVVGFMGEHLRLLLTYTKKDSTIHHRRSFFLKTPPIFNTTQAEYVAESGIFRKEVFLYRNLLASLLKIGHFGPKCLLVKDNCIVLEDLQTRGFNLQSRVEYLGEKYCLELVKTLARFHASSIIYEEKNGLRIAEKFQEETREVCYSFVEGQPRQKWCVNVTKCLQDCMQLLGASQETCAKFHSFVFKDLPVLLKPSKKFRNALTHDDLHTNNALFNEDKECLLVDFQMARCTPPALDFHQVLWLNMDGDYLSKNYQKLVDLYHFVFANEFKQNGLDAEELLSKSEFEESLEYYRLAAVTESAMYASHICIPQDLAERILQDLVVLEEFSFSNRSKHIIKVFNEDAQFRQRLGTILDSLIKLLS